jgi:tetratricopeptide (TPR) repeat protein
VNTAASELVEGLAHHQAGRVGQAEALYQHVLVREPDNPDALHLLGMLAHGANRHEEAARRIARAVQLRGNVAPFHNNLGVVLQALGRHHEAGLCFAQALAVSPDYVEAHINFGNALQSLGLPGEAILHCRRAIELKPDCAEAHNNLGNIRLAEGDGPAAEACFRAALAIRPAYAEAWLNLSGALKEEDRFEEAVACCQEALHLTPDLAEAWSNLAAMLSAMERLDPAEHAARQALALKPGLAEPHVVLAVIEQAQGRFPEAEASSREALRLRGDYAEASNNLGNAVQEQGRLEEAEASYRAALRSKPKLADAHYNLGNVLRLSRRLAEAGACYERAIRLRPGYVKAHWNLAHVLLAAGDMQRGWEEFEWRWKKKDTPPRCFPQPAWDGAPLDGRTILLHAEQGLGDAIQFIRYAELVKRSGGTVLFECPAKLAGLFETVQGIDALAPAGAPLPAFDVQAPLLGLPRIFHTTLARIPAGVPYLAAGADCRSKWKERLAGYQGRKIGLVWRGNPQHAENRSRSLNPETLSPLAGVPGITWFSLQFGENGAPPPIHGLVDLGPETEDFRDAAAAVEQMDLVISADTSMAHLAGALARPVWVLLACVPDWRWLLDREDTPWYPTMRLFRQRQPGEWKPVTEAVREALDSPPPK